MIKLVSQGRLDRTRYAECIRSSAAPMPYAFPEHLDCVAPGWSVLVLGDYESVMPVPFHCKYIFPRFYQPPYTQQLGLFGKHQEDVEVLDAFLQKLSQSFWGGQLQLNFLNPLPEKKGRKVRLRKNYVIPLSEPYESVQKRYRKGHRSAIRQAKKMHQVVRGVTGAEEFVRLLRHGGDRNAGKALKKLIELYGADSVWTAVLPDGRTGAVGFFPQKEAGRGRRVVYLAGATTEAGRQAKSAHVLIDSVLEHYSGGGGWFDFEGSELPGVARFFRGFGPVAQDYPYLEKI